MSFAASIDCPSLPLTTQVRMHLDFGGERLSVQQLGLDFAIVVATAARPPGTAQLIVQVDGDRTVRTVYLPDGVQVGIGRTRLAPLD